MTLHVGNREVEVDEEGYLRDPRDWDEAVALAIAAEEGIELTPVHWMLIAFFRTFWEKNERHPTMHEWIETLGGFHGRRYSEAKAYRDYLYTLFPKGPLQTIAKLAGLPKPVGDVQE